MIRARGGSRGDSGGRGGSMPWATTVAIASRSAVARLQAATPLLLGLKAVSLESAMIGAVRKRWFAPSARLRRKRCRGWKPCHRIASLRSPFGQPSAGDLRCASVPGRFATRFAHGSVFARLLLDGALIARLFRYPNASLEFRQDEPALQMMIEPRTGEHQDETNAQGFPQAVG